MTTTDSRARDYTSWLFAVLLLLVSSMGGGWLAFHPRADAGSSVAAIFPPWWTANRITSAAASSGASIVREGLWPNILVLRSERNDLPRRLRDAGAWLVLDPIALAGCLGAHS